MMIIGIDPGASTGMAIYKNGVLGELRTIRTFELERALRNYWPDRIIFEDSRLQSHAWNAIGNRAEAVKIARNIGQIDAWCNLITELCADLTIPAHGVSPRAKGGKVDAARFEARTGWAGRSNQHERDAAMVAWPYRLVSSGK